MPACPDSIATINPEWLTQVLRKNGCISCSKVTAIRVQQIGTEIGFLDSLARLILTFDQAEHGAPDSLVIKVSSSEATYRQIGGFYNAYEREFRFMRRLPRTRPFDFLDVLAVKLTLRRILTC